MARAYSIDLRERVTKAVAAGLTVRAVALQFNIVPSTVVKWSKRLRATGSAAPGKQGGARRPILAGETKTWLLERIATKPDLTVRALQAELAGRGVKVGHNAVWRVLRAEGISFKKKASSRQNRIAPESPGIGKDGLPVRIRSMSNA